MLLAVATAPVHSQSNEIVDRILAEEELTYGSAAYLLLLASDSIDEDATLASAAEALNRSGLGLENRGANDPITLGEYALLTMRVFAVPGGIAWSIHPAPRYATRELEYRRVIQGQVYPNMKLSGERAMRILGRVLNLREGGAL
ncbi:MAG: hypothetical protein EA427_00090 [Spirochaetaceae bacterium]|nr:MAG: hypothetical protein EA427_00090 [Spirochaetaceae bacterium]